MSRRTRLAALAALLTTALLAAAPLGSAQAPAQQIVNGSFANGLAPWWHTGNLAPSTAGERLCTTVPGPTTNPWDAIIGQDNINIVEGVTYEFSFVASSAPRDVTVRALIQNPTTFATFTDRNPALTGTNQTFSYTFTAASSLPNAQVAFQIGGASEPWTFCLDDVSLLGGAEPEPYVPDTGPRVRVNQVGYLPFGPKAATLVTEATAEVKWQLKDAAGRVVKQGKSDPRGVDPTSGLNVHEIVFSGFRGDGSGFTLTADGETSHPFDIAADAYERLRVDALSFYYPQRSGTPILDSIIPGYGRAAGHLSIAPNQGDFDVPCQPAAVSLPIYGEPWTCDYTLDVTGGWYDAGDHGKYVVNGGISVAQLMSTYERNLNRARHADAGALGDSTLRIPERGNGVPDVLDEARWELEWMLTMQVPAGKPLAGMAHHKIHDNAWTGLPLDPAADPMKRELHRPSTAATLNLAAAAAQGARLFQPYDAAFAARLLAAARTAWTAANANPSLFAPAADGNSGGGPYDDSFVVDEFYWAAAELFITTGEAAYGDAVTSSPLHTANIFDVTGFYWGYVAPLGRLDLATLKNRLGPQDLRRVQSSVLAAADALVAVQNAQAWGQPYAPANNMWAWGSTSQILNNIVVLATAYDISGHDRYQDAALEAVDFLLGRNALNISYVTGYGEVHSKNQHSRWYAHQLNSELPNPPVGSIAGGPNSSIQDPVAQEFLRGCAPQFCYIDDIGSWSTNELTINWNAPLSWVASFVADQDEGGRP
jgi:endoglucanase